MKVISRSHNLKGIAWLPSAWSTPVLSARAWPLCSADNLQLFPHLTSFHSVGPNGSSTEHPALWILNKNKKRFQFAHSVPSFLSWFIPRCAVGSLIPSHLFVFLMWLSIPPSLNPDAFIPCSEICWETYSFLVVLFIALAYSVLCFIHSPPHHKNGVSTRLNKMHIYSMTTGTAKKSALPFLKTKALPMYWAVLSHGQLYQGSWPASSA